MCCYITFKTDIQLKKIAADHRSLGLVFYILRRYIFVEFLMIDSTFFSWGHLLVFTINKKNNCFLQIKHILARITEPVHNESVVIIYKLNQFIKFV